MNYNTKYRTDCW